eukprot:09532_2
MARRHLRPVVGLLGVGLVAVLAVMTLVSDETTRTVLADLHGPDNPIPVHVGNWRTDNKALWCGEDPDCAYGNVAKDKEKAYADPSPLAIINDDYKE